jgi:alcohol dehydrogenase class IV
VFSNVRVEPTDSSFKEAIDFAKTNGPFDAFVGVGGGSTIGIFLCTFLSKGFLTKILNSLLLLFILKHI